MTNAEARFNNSLRPRKPEGSLGRTAQDVHLDSHIAPELWVHSCWTRFSNIAVWEAGENTAVWQFSNGVCVSGHTKISSHPWRLKTETNRCLHECPGTLSHTNCFFLCESCPTKRQTHTAPSPPDNPTLRPALQTTPHCAQPSVKWHVSSGPDCLANSSVQRSRVRVYVGTQQPKLNGALQLGLYNSVCTAYCCACCQ